VAGGVSVSVKANVKAVLRDLKRVRKQIVPQVTARSLNTVARGVETRAVAGVAVAAGLPKSRVRWQYDRAGSRTSRRRLRKHPARPDRLVVGFVLRPRTVPLISLGARQTRRGVRAGSRFVDSGFIAESHVRKRTGPPRYPIEIQSVRLDPHADQVFSRVIGGAGPAFTREFTRQLDRRLRRR